MNQPVFVAGTGVISAIGNNLSENLEALVNCRAGIGQMKYLDSVYRDKLPVAEVKLSNEAPNLKVRNIEVGADGSVFLALEEYYYTVSTTTYNNHTTTTYTYYYEDILGAKIDASGNFLWIKKIPKKQKGTNSFQTLGYKLVSDTSGYYFLYLDNKKNLELEEDEVPKYHINGYGGQVMVAKIDHNGNISKELLFDTRDEELMVMPRLFKKIDGNNYIGRTTIKGPGAYKPLLISVK